MASPEKRVSRETELITEVKHTKELDMPRNEKSPKTVISDTSAPEIKPHIIESECDMHVASDPVEKRPIPNAVAGRIISIAMDNPFTQVSLQQCFVRYQELLDEAWGHFPSDTLDAIDADAEAIDHEELSWRFAWPEDLRVLLRKVNLENVATGMEHICTVDVWEGLRSKHPHLPESHSVFAVYPTPRIRHSDQFADIVGGWIKDAGLTDELQSAMESMEIVMEHALAPYLVGAGQDPEELKSACTEAFETIYRINVALAAYLDTRLEKEVEFHSALFATATGLCGEIQTHLTEGPVFKDLVQTIGNTDLELPSSGVRTVGRDVECLIVEISEMCAVVAMRSCTAQLCRSMQGGISLALDSRLANRSPSEISWYPVHEQLYVDYSIVHEMLRLSARPASEQLPAAWAHMRDILTTINGLVMERVHGPVQEGPLLNDSMLEQISHGLRSVLWTMLGLNSEQPRIAA